MNYILLKKTAIVVLITFVSMIAAPHYSFAGADCKELEEALEKAEELYKKGIYDRAMELFDRIIEMYRGNEGCISEVSDAYYYKARIYFSAEEYGNMEAALRNLYKINENYGFYQEDNLDFIKRANEIRDRCRKEKEQVTNIIEKPGTGKKPKKFPWLLVAGGVIVVGALVYLLSKKKAEKKTLTVTVGEGVEGIPAAGTYSYKKGETVSYSYSLKSGYHVLSVKLDGNETTSSGTIKMDQDHTLTVSASKQYTLTVMKGEGVAGIPDSGTFIYNEGAQVSYNYTLQSGYENLIVKLDGSVVPASGTITMNKDHTLIASTGKTYQLTVDKGEGVDGTPEKGTFSYQEGETVNYSYSLQSGYDNLFVTLDGIQVASSGTITMDRDHTLTASAAHIDEYTLNVTKGQGVNGTPESGRYTYKSGQTINYNYSLQDGYKDLVVTLDGNPVSASGTVTMNKNHTLNASATAIGKYTLTVTRGEGVIGTPSSGSYPYNEGVSVSYGYTLQDGYKDLVVTLDGNPVGASGTVTMNKNHTLNASATPIGEYTLTVTRGEGVNGTPETGSYKYEPGKTINYNYSLQDGYKDLVVTLDGSPVSASGTVTMNSNHTLNASATVVGKCTLTVTKGTGVNGTPNSGTFSYNEGETVNYSYSLKSGYKNLVVTLDGKQVSASGTITMNTNHALNASATPKKEYTLTVTRGQGVNGTPESGTFTYTEGETVNYSYSLQAGYQSLVVKLDGNIVSASGTITMNANHTLSAEASNTYTLTVTKGTGVDGTPGSGTFTYNKGDTVDYSYTLQSGYIDLIVTLDGNPVDHSGTITMNANHTLSASAKKKWKLTVTRDDGVDGNPVTGIYTFADGSTQSYSYTLQSGYKDLIVRLDGNLVAASGTITMNSDHTLTASATATAAQKSKNQEDVR